MKKSFKLTIVKTESIENHLFYTLEACKGALEDLIIIEDGRKALGLKSIRYMAITKNGKILSEWTRKMS